MKKTLIIGCGYLGKKIAHNLQEAGREVCGTTRSEARAAELEEAGIPAALLELETVGEAAALEGEWEAAVYCAAPGRGGREALVFRDAAAACRDRLAENGLRRFVYVSSTGVYHQDSGELLDETSPAEPLEGRPALLREAEKIILEGDTGDNIVVRLGGLYGPGRSPIEWLRRPGFRERLRGSAEAWMNWIHIDDAAAAVCAAVKRGRKGELYLGVDGAPVKRIDFYRCAAELAGEEPPELDTASTDLGKRLSNRKLVEELGVSLLYPDYRRGLESIA